MVVLGGWRFLISEVPLYSLDSRKGAYPYEVVFPAAPPHVNQVPDVRCLHCRFLRGGVEFRVQGSGFRVQGSEFRVSGS